MTDQINTINVRKALAEIEETNKKFRESAALIDSKIPLVGIDETELKEIKKIGEELVRQRQEATDTLYNSIRHKEMTAQGCKDK